MRKDFEVALTAVTNNGRALGNVDETLLGDRRLVLAAVRSNGHALQYAHVRMRQDREIALAAVAQDCHALLHVAAELRGDREVVLAALKEDPYAWAHAHNKAQLSLDPVVTVLRIPFEECARNLLVALTKAARRKQPDTDAERNALVDAMLILEKRFPSCRPLVDAAVAALECPYDPESGAPSITGKRNREAVAAECGVVDASIDTDRRTPR